MTEIRSMVYVFVPGCLLHYRQPFPRWELAVRRFGH
jgi:hypothetical protein